MSVTEFKAIRRKQRYFRRKMFTTIDFCIFAAFLALAMLVGVYHALKSKREQAKSLKTEKTAEFLLGGRKLPIIPVCLSLLATFVSSISLLGAPAEIYQRGVFRYQSLYYDVRNFGHVKTIINLMKKLKSKIYFCTEAIGVGVGNRLIGFKSSFMR